MKILTLDIETSPNLAHVWGLWQQNVGLNQLLMPTEMMCWAAKWEDSDEVFYKSLVDGREEMVKALWYLLDAADVVVHYNGTKFDIPHINREFLEAGMKPPSTYKQVDLLTTVKSKFKFPSNKLDYVAQALRLGKKIEHEGHTLWLKCLNGDRDAWKRMQEYNEGDILLTEKLFKKLRPWIRTLPNAIMYSTDAPTEIVCTCCGSDKVKKKGFEYTSVSKFQRYVCKECGKNMRGRENLIDRTSLVLGV